MTPCEAILILSVQVFASIAQWERPLEAVGEAYCIDPNLLAAQMWHESKGDPVAVSSAGAVGLMQVMPSDNFVRPDLSFHWRPTSEQLFAPSFNIEYGARIMRQLLQENGSLRLSLALYNCGSVNLEAGKCGKGGGWDYADKVMSTYLKWVMPLWIERTERWFQDCTARLQC